MTYNVFSGTLNPTQSINQSINLAQLMAESPYTYNGFFFPPNLSFPMGDMDPHLIQDLLGPPESSTQTASQLVQPVLFSRFCTDDRRVFLYFTVGCPFPLKIAPSHGGIWTPSNTWFLGQPESSIHLDRFSHFCRAQ